MKPEVVARGTCRVGVRLAAYEVVVDRARIGAVVAKALGGRGRTALRYGAVVVRVWPLGAEAGGKGGGGGGDG